MYRHILKLDTNKPIEIEELNTLLEGIDDSLDKFEERLNLLEKRLNTYIKTIKEILSKSE